MSGTFKKATATSGTTPALKIGSRVRCTDDDVTERITGANAGSVQVQWDDGEQVTWKRDFHASRHIEILDADTDPRAQPSQTPESPNQVATPKSTSVEQAAVAPQRGSRTGRGLISWPTLRK